MTRRSFFPPQNNFPRDTARLSRFSSIVFAM
jgi:hypothetical protein